MSFAWLVVGLGLAWVVYGYLGYPLVLLALRRLAPRPVRSAEVAPPLSFILAVHDGEAHLERKLAATLALDYPGPLEVIVASDGSRDGTDAIAERFADRGVVLVRNPERQGKEAAQARAIRRATGELLAFSDVTAELEPDALTRIVQPFADPSVGCVSSEDVVAGTGGEGAYVRYEMALRRLESETTSLIGLSGSFFAARRALCEPWPADLASDFRVALEAARRGLRAVSEPRARARFGAVRETRDEWVRKVRTVQRGIAVLSAYRDVLHPRHGRAAFTLWSHKAVRFGSPFALLAVALASLPLAASGPWGLALVAAQGLGYGLGGLSLLRPSLPLGPARLLGFFLLVNASTLVAWRRHWTGPRAVTWQPTSR